MVCAYNDLTRLGLGSSRSESAISEPAATSQTSPHVRALRGSQGTSRCSCRQRPVSSSVDSSIARSVAEYLLMTRSAAALCSLRGLALWATSLAALAGCTTTPAGRTDLLEFLADGTTSRQEIRARLGAPRVEFEEGRILTYRVGKGPRGYFTGCDRDDDWSTCRYSLVLVLNSEGILTRHSLVEVRPR